MQTYEENPLEYITEALYEKRAATREKALTGLVQYLRSSYRFEECESWKETLAERLAACVKKGKAKEATLACTAVALMVATLGQSSDGWTEQLVEEFLPLLRPKVTLSFPPHDNTTMQLKAGGCSDSRRLISSSG